MVKKCYAKVLGEKYIVNVGDREELERPMPEDWDGMCYPYDKEIYVVDKYTDVVTQEGREEILTEILTHEISHAFIHESGFNVHSDEEDLVVWLGKNVRKINNCVIEVLDELGEI